MRFCNLDELASGVEVSRGSGAWLQLLRGAETMRRPTSLPVPSGDSDSLSSLGGGSRGRHRSPPRRPADLPLQARGRSPSRTRGGSRANTPARSSAAAPAATGAAGSPLSGFSSPELSGPLPYSAYTRNFDTTG